MITKMFSVYDSKAECFGTPFFMPTRGMAIRAFTDLAKDERSQVNKHKLDFALYEIAEFDDRTGTVLVKTPTNLGLASEYVSMSSGVVVPPAAVLREPGLLEPSVVTDVDGKA